MRNLEWKHVKTSEARIWNCVAAGMKIVKYHGWRKYILLSRNSKLELRTFFVAKKVAQLIYNG